MFEVELIFDLKKDALNEQAKEFWTVKNNVGYEFFKEKASLALLNLGTGQILEFLAYINGSYNRDILVDFKTSYFIIKEKNAVVDEQGNTKVFITIKPTIKVF